MKPENIYKKDNVQYDVDKLNQEAKDLFAAMLTAQGKLREAEINAMISRAALMKLHGEISTHLTDDAIFNPDQLELLDSDSIGNK